MSPRVEVKREELIGALRQRGDRARRAAFVTDFYALPQAVQDALYGLAALVESAADELEATPAPAGLGEWHLSIGRDGETGTSIEVRINARSGECA